MCMLLAGAGFVALIVSVLRFDRWLRNMQDDGEGKPASPPES